MTNAFKYGGVDFAESEFLEAEKNSPEKYDEMKAKIAAWEEKYPNHAKGDTSKIKDTPSGNNNQSEGTDSYKYFDPVEGIFTNTPNKNTIELKTDNNDIKDIVKEDNKGFFSEMQSTIAKTVKKGFNKVYPGSEKLLGSPSDVKDFLKDEAKKAVENLKKMPNKAREDLGLNPVELKAYKSFSEVRQERLDKARNRIGLSGNTPIKMEEKSAEPIKYSIGASPVKESEKTNSTGLAMKKELSPHAQDLQAVFDNLKQYQGKYGDDIKSAKFESDFQGDMSKIMDSFKKHKNDAEVTGLLKENLHLVSGTLTKGGTHRENDVVRDFITAMTKEMFETPAVSLENRVNIGAGIGDMAKNRGYNYFSSGSNKEASYDILREQKHNTPEMIAFMAAYDKNEQYVGNRTQNGRNTFEDKKSATEIMSFLKHNENVNPTTKSQFGIDAVKQFPDDATMFVIGTNLLKEADKEDPAAALSSMHILVGKPSQDAPKLSQKKFDHDRKELLDQMSGKMKTAKEGEPYSPETLGKRMASEYYGFVQKQGYPDYGKDIMNFVNENRDNKDFVKAFNKEANNHRSLKDRMLEGKAVKTQ